MNQSIKKIKKLFFEYFCFHKKFLVYNLVSRNIKTKYARSWIGLGWTLLHPLLLASMYYLVFKKIMKIQMEHYVSFVLSGVLPWAFFSQSVVESIDALVNNSGLVTKIPLPLQVFSWVNVLTNGVTLLGGLPILFIVSLLQGVWVGWAIFWVFYLLMCLAFFAYGLSFVLSLAYVFLRDLKHAFGFLLQLWMFLTPVVYSAEMIPAQYRWCVHLNPVADMIVGLHQIFAKGLSPAWEELGWSTFWALMSTSLGLILLHFRSLRVLEKL